MKKIYFLSILALVTFTGFAQFTTTTYRGAFAPAPAAMWTDTWTEFNPQDKAYPTPNVTVSANITTNTIWTAGNTYALGGQIYVKNNATLTIEPGVIIRSNAPGAGLFITKGAKLIAEGTASSPIVFTSGNTVGNRNLGDWGGIILLGKGSYNINGGINNIEGIAPSADTEFGGGATPDDNDNSGSLKYVRIEYAGFTYGAAGSNTEINGLTFGAVGKGTKIDYVQVSYANDDSYEWFGGAVDCFHLVAFNGIDDDFDTDNGFSGKVQFCLGIRNPTIADSSGSNGFESDNNSTSTSGTSFTRAVFSNCTLVGPTYRTTLPSGGALNSNHRRAAHLRRNTQLQIWNSIFIDFFDGVVVDGNTTTANATANTMKFKSNIIAGTVASKVAVKVESPTTTFDVATWFTSNNNTSQTTSAGLLTLPYNTTDGSIYTGLDYRPAVGSIALTGADFTTLSNEKFVANAEFSLKVYPNPSSDSFKINYSSSNIEVVKLAAYDITGKTIETLNVDYDAINNQQIGNDYAPGVYLISLKQGDINKTIRVIKK
ncbi:T9SS type A sorting domain-containing protein [Flavobacterium nackdongense]|uniref:T9SS type A sorting domain-containing protein n=1 Tax=Flavobacterium nackdongense TaxID=2547394 RepID=A0A4P6YAZ5_9FLAO|nr:T9SS type A sorting domain-containing protein [Flavobacterium nackdongense]QBN19328.1 T9SS type A sorting domain-containing protein [Flavobacterium nackdongense]